MKMENRTENKELDLKNQVENLELVDRMLSILNRIEIAIITVGLIAMLAITL